MVSWPWRLHKMSEEEKERARRILLSMTMMEAAAISLLRTLDHERDELRQQLESVSGQ